jgi:hypothetical protein
MIYFRWFCTFEISRFYCIVKLILIIFTRKIIIIGHCLLTI